ncbi:hypothetical protein GGQ88_003735 [Novosphingobium hassiacum]|uniref:Uncharacterized protein n=1 Tax=Novosphingobium hassiacum TaxID=173676 RepID=A0A7W6A091_9SPHN|nr:hypothetical protein [Novosphingobium hassiacum]MBB3862434.1 hypothetical protein [Novosphingobium hassiacum]
MTVTKRKPKPTTAHPMFPFVTALWFATFLGLGSFAVAPALLEGPVVALGLPALVPAAAPPLGFTARLLFALAMMGLGGIAGYLVGRALGRGKVEAPVRARGFGKQAQDKTGFEARRPINPSEDLGAPLDAPIAQDVPLRRRALSLHDESQLSTPFESAPLPGFLPWEVAAQDAEVEAEAEPAAQPGPTPAAIAMQTTPADPLALDLLLEEAQTFGETSYEPVATSTPEVAADLDHVFGSSPLTFDAPDVAEAAPFTPTAPAPSYQPSPILQAQQVQTTPIEHAALDSLGLVQLIERLALAISRRARRAEPSTAAPAVDAPAPTAAPEAREIPRFGSSALTDPAPAASAEYRAAPERVVQLRPAQFQPVAAPEFDASFGDDGEDEDEDLGLDRFLRMSPLRTREPAVHTEQASPGDAAPEPEVAEERYPSLLDIGPVAASREPLRIDDGIADEPEEDAAIEPVVVFPGQQQARQFERPSITPLAGSPLAAPGRAAPSPPTADTGEGEVAGQSGPALDADEADRALRAALATLQRMTAQG